MKKIFESIIVKRIQLDSHPPQATRCLCNYQNNYYGDQTCIPYKKTKV